MLKKSLVVFSVPLIASLTFGLLMSPPAQALDPVLFDPRADGQGGDDDELLVVACTDRVFAFAPIPTKVGGFSSFEQLQLGGVQFTLKHGLQSFSQDSASNWPAMDQLGIRFEEPYSVGATVNLSIRAEISGYAPGEFNFSTTVINSSFDQGAGTASDPYVVSSKADLNKMRCYDNAYFELSDDIDMTGKWLPIGVNTFDNNLRWSGYLDGNGHSIENFEVGHLTMRGVGLFGSVNNTHVRDLNFDSPNVIGSRDVGVLVGYAERTSVSNVKIEDADVEGFHSVGLLMGRKNWGGIVSGVSVEGSILGMQYAYRDNTNLDIVGPRELGGLIGYDDGGGSGSTNNVVVVDIDILAEADFVARAAANSPSLTPRIAQNVNQVGGLFGETDETSTFSYFKVDSDINIEVFGLIDEVGGVIGESESALFHLDVDSAINIVHLGVTTLNSFTNEIGGVVGACDDQTVSFANVTSVISISQANGSNNALEIDLVGTEQNVRRIGGMGGYWNDIQSDNFNRVRTVISVEGPAAQEIAGYVGSADNFHAFGVTNLVVTGTLDVNTSSANGIGGFTNLVGSARINGDLVIAAVSVSVSAEGATNVGPFLGTDSNPTLNRLASAFWDSDQNPDFVEGEHYPESATSAELKSRSNLERQGMDFEGAWRISSGQYPALQPCVYLWKFDSGCADGRGNVFPSPGIPSAPSTGSQVYAPSEVIVPDSAPSGSVVTVRGKNLNFVSKVIFNNQALDYTIKSDGTMTFSLPIVGEGMYALSLSGISTGNDFNKQFTVTRSATPVTNPRSVTLNYTNFIGDRSVLTAAARAGITRALAGFTSIDKVVCTGSTSGTRATAADRSLATARAKSACDLIKRLRPEVVVELKATPARGVGPRFRSVSLQISGR
jgi:hypothetical protein